MKNSTNKNKIKIIAFPMSVLKVHSKISSKKMFPVGKFLENSERRNTKILCWGNFSTVGRPYREVSVLPM